MSDRSFTMKKKKIELISLDESRNLQYQGSCKITINLLSKVLLIVPENEEFKMISAMFKWDFVKSDNILFVLAEYNFQDFALVFDDSQRCTKVFDRIECNKNSISIRSQLFIDRFIFPIFGTLVASNPSRIKDIMIKWISNHKDLYIELMKANNVYDIIFPHLIKSRDICDKQTSRKRKHSALKIINAENDDNEQNILDLDNNDDIFEKINNGKGFGINKHEIKYEENAIDPSCFKLIHFKQHRCLRRGIIVFSSSDKTHCYEYNWNFKKELFFCRGCQKHRSRRTALKTEDSIKLENKPHICSPILYEKENYVELKIIKKPDYEMIENVSKKSKQMLIIFASDDRKKCYEYSYDKVGQRYYCRGCRGMRTVRTVEMFNKNTVNEYVMLMSEEHVCQVRKYNFEKFHENFYNFVLFPNFEIRTKIKEDGNERKTLIIFAENDRNLCYTYFYHNNENQYKCNGCSQKGKRVGANICKNAENEEYVILSKSEHICSLRQYIPEDKQEIILRPPDIEFMETTKSGTPKLFVFNENNRKFCHIFSPIFGDNKQNRYYCLGCEQKQTKEKPVKSMDGRMLKGIVTVYLCKSDNGEYFIKMKDGQKHICERKKYEPEKYELEILVNPGDFILFREKGKKPGSINLGIYHSEDRKLCYKFYYSPAMKYFRCFGCEKIKAGFVAKIHVKEDGSEYITVKQKKHVCSPIKVSSIYNTLGTVVLKKSGLNIKPAEEKKKKKVDENKILRSPNFEFQRNKTGVLNGKLLIFKADDKSQCYSYHYNNCSKYYFCSRCKAKNISVTAKLHKDDKSGEEYIVLGSREHLCETIKYVPEKEIIEAPNFKILNKNESNKTEKLITYTSAAKDLYYEYIFSKTCNFFICMSCQSMNKRVAAKILKDENGNEYIQLLKNDHICEPQKTEAETIQPKTIIITESDFKLLPSQDRKPNSKLLIFDPHKNDYVFEYNLIKDNQFVCLKCSSKNKQITAEMFEKENGEKYFEVSTLDHFCKSTKYLPEKYLPKKTMNNNFVVQHNNSGEPNSRITIFNENDNNFGYDYFLKKSVNSFFCCGCNNEKKKYISAKLFTDKNGKQFLELGKQGHCCNIRNLKEKNRIFEDFKLEEGGKVIVTKDLTKKNRFYKFNFEEKLGVFCCLKCKGKQRKGKFVTTNICKDNNGKEFLFLNDFHCCVSVKK